MPPSASLRRRVYPILIRLTNSQQILRETSVVDRPGDWGLLYDRVIEAVHRVGDLVWFCQGSLQQVSSMLR